MKKTVLIFYESKRDFSIYDTLTVKDTELEFCSFHDAPDLSKHQQVGIVILDCDYDVSRALELLKLIKFSLSSVPVMFLTRLSSEEIVIKAYRGGAREYFRKPVNIDEFQEAIEKLLVIKNASREKRVPLQIFHNNDGRDFFEHAITDKPFSITRALQYIQQHFAEDISLPRLAEEANLSKFHFCRFFKKHMGMSPSKFVAVLRVERSKELLRQKDFSISMVATLVGFNDLGNFERHFKKVTGATPSSYQESIGRKDISMP